ncbi:hypothetical protein FF1_007029 [Malus domestica]
MLTTTFVITKTLAKESAHVGLVHKTRSARAFASSGTHNPLEFIDITATSEEEQSTVEIDGDEKAGESLATEESSNTSAESNPRSGGHPHASLGKDTEGEDSGRELSCNDDSKTVEYDNLDEVDGFLNDDV